MKVSLITPLKYNSMNVIRYEVKDAVAVIQLNNLATMNSITNELAKEFIECLQLAKNDNTVRCIVITGEDKSFCSGQDLKEVMGVFMQGKKEFSTLIEKKMMESYNVFVTEMRTMEKPIIAAVNGVAAGAGANLALCADLVVASRSAVFVQAFISIALIPDTAGTFFLPRLVGSQRAFGLAALGEKITADEAERFGLVWKVFDDNVFLEETMKIAKRLASLPTKAIGLTKKAMNMAFENTLEEQLDLEIDMQVQSAESHDCEEGIRAFLEKRKPNFSGK